jgi:hypothetical protein
VNFVRCPHCGLRHSEREDRRCPRCHEALDSAPSDDAGAEPYRPPVARVSSPAPFSFGHQGEDESFGMGARIAGVLFILNSLSIFYAGIAFKVPMSGPGRASSAIVDMILGCLLVLGQRKVVPFCMVRVVLGAVLFLGLSLYSGDYTSAVMQVALSGSLLGLLVGTPGLARLGVSSAVAVCYVLYAAFILHGGTRVRDAKALLAAREIEVIGPKDVTGVGYDYHFKAPNDQWFLRSQELAKRESPICDRWLVRPDKDAHFIVIAEDFVAQRSGAVDIDAYQTAVLANLKNAATKVDVLETGVLFERYDQSRRVHARATVKGLSIDYTFGLVVFRNQGFQFIGFASEAEFPSLAGEYQQMFDSLVIGEK